MIIQKKKGTETSFDFKESFLHYKIKDTTGTRTLKIHYTNIEIQYIDEFVEQNEWLRNVGILWVCLGLFFIITSGKPDIWLFIGLACLVIFHFGKVHFSILHCDEGNILIIKNKEHDEILSTIKEHKRKILRERLFFRDESNDHEQEINKFEFLRDEGAISEEEYKTMCSNIVKQLH